MGGERDVLTVESAAKGKEPEPSSHGLTSCSHCCSSDPEDEDNVPRVENCGRIIKSGRGCVCAANDACCFLLCYYSRNYSSIIISSLQTDRPTDQVP